MAALVALFATETQRREMEYRVFKLAIGSTAGTAGVAAAAVKLADAGLL